MPALRTSFPVDAVFTAEAGVEVHKAARGVDDEGNKPKSSSPHQAYRKSRRNGKRSGTPKK